MRILRLNDLEKGLPGITPVIGAFYMEAVIVSLVKMGFKSGVHLSVYGEFNEVFKVKWATNLSQNQIDYWKEETHYHSAGAVGISLLLVKVIKFYHL